MAFPGSLGLVERRGLALALALVALSPTRPAHCAAPRCAFARGAFARGASACGAFARGASTRCASA